MPALNTHAVPGTAEPLVVFAGRHIPEKRVPLIPAVIAEARRQLPDLRCAVYGDGPERAELLRRIRASGLDGGGHGAGLRRRRA